MQVNSITPTPQNQNDFKAKLSQTLSKQNQKISDVSIKAIKPNPIVRGWKWIVNHLKGLVNGLTKIINALFLRSKIHPTQKSSESMEKTSITKLSSKPEVNDKAQSSSGAASLIENMQVVSFQLMDQTAEMFQVHALQTRMLTQNALQIELSDIDPATLQHLSVLCQELDEYLCFAGDVLKQVSGESKEIMITLLSGLSEAKEKLDERLKFFNSGLEKAVKQQLTEIEKGKEKTSLLPHQKVLVQELTRSEGLLAKNVSKNLIQRATIIKKEISKPSPHSANDVQQKEPPQFDNIGNSCYIDSTLQVLLANQSFKQFMLKDINRNQGEFEEDFSKRKHIQSIFKRLVDAIDHPHDKSRFGLGEDLLQEIVKELRLAVFDLELSEFPSFAMTAQQDAAALASLLISVLGAEVLINEQDQFTIKGQNKVSKETKISSETTFKVGFFGKETNLQSMINNKIYDRNVLDTNKEFIVSENISPSDIVSVDKLYKVKQYITKKTFENNPSALMLHIGRDGIVKGKASKIKTPINVPSNLELDFSAASASGHLKYVINGFVVHLGNSMQYGHYISFVRRGKQWFKCDDMLSAIVKVNDKEIQGHIKQAYLLSLQKI